MVLLTLIAYMTVFPLIWVVSSTLIGLPAILSPMICAVVAPIVSHIAARIGPVYAPECVPPTRSMLRLGGVKWICAVAALGAPAVFALVWLAFGRWPGGFAAGLLVPSAILAFVNAIGVESVPTSLSVAAPGKVVLPDIDPQPETPSSRLVQEPTAEELVKKFHWVHLATNYALTLVLRRTVYEECKAQARVLDPMQWSNEYVIGGLSGEIRDLAHELYRLGRSYGSYDEVSLVLAFVQQVITYEREEGEYPRFPIETLGDERGDCEDFAILGASILKAMGYEVALLFVPGHAALGVAGATGLPGAFREFDGKRFYYCDMTGEGWKIGQMPDQYAPDQIRVSPVPAAPVKIVRPAAHAAVS